MKVKTQVIYITDNALKKNSPFEFLKQGLLIGNKIKGSISHIDTEYSIDKCETKLDIRYIKQ